MSELDRGEFEEIVLALEKHADLLLLDDADVRDKAKLYNIPITGTLGVLLQAKNEGKIESFGDTFEQIRATGFWGNERLKRRFLTEAEEL